MYRWCVLWGDALCASGITIARGGDCSRMVSQCEAFFFAGYMCCGEWMVV